jgi:hypothetical protein
LTVFGLLAATVALFLSDRIRLDLVAILTPAIQLYVRDVESRLERPDKDLKGFAKVTLQPNESREVQTSLRARDAATQQRLWQVSDELTGLAASGRW